MKIRQILAGAMAVLAFASCEKAVEALVKIDSNQLEFTSEGGTQTVSFTATANWTVTGQEKAGGWITVSPESGKGSAEKQELEIKVTPNDGEDRSAVITIQSNVFAKKSIRINQEGHVVEAKQITVAEFLQKKDTETAYVLEGVISGLANTSYKGFDLTDETGTVPCAFPENFDEKVSELANGCTVRIQGKYAYYESKNLDQMANGTILSITPAAEYEITACTVAEFISKADKIHEYRLSGTISKFNSQYCSFDLTDESGNIFVYSVTDKSKEEYTSKLKDGHKVTLTGFYDYYSSKQQHEVINATIESYEEGEPVEVEKTKLYGVVVAVNKTGFLLKAEDGYKYFYDKDITPEVAVGDVVEAEAEQTEYLGLVEYENYTLTKKRTQAVTHPEPTALTGTAFDSFTTQFGYASFSGKLTVSGNYYNVKVSGADNTGSLAGPTLPADVESGKIIDVTGYYLYQSGSSTKYQNFIVTSIKLSDDQTGTDEPLQEVSLEPAEDEVLYTLTNEEIVAYFAAQSDTKGGYGDLKIGCSYGDWTGNVYVKKDLKFIQLRSKEKAHVKSPTFSTDIKRIVLSNNATTLANRTFHIIPASTELPTGDYSASLWDDEYGNVKPEGSLEWNYQIDITTAGVKDFTVVVQGGSVYLDAIYVFCAK